MRVFRLLLIFASLACASTAQAGVSKRKLAQLARDSGLDAERLKALGAERFFARDVYQRRQFVKDIADKPAADLLRLITLLGTRETKDEPIRRCSIRLYSHVGLLADRRDIEELVLPAVSIALGYGKKRGQDQRWALEELVRLARWFRMDAELAALLQPVFEGKDFNLRSKAFQALCSIRHETLEERLLVPACLKVYGSTKGYGLFDRFRAVRELRERRVELIGPLLRDALAAGKDPKMQENAMYVFCDWEDPSTLPLARSVRVTAVHRLRRAAFRARVALGDETTVDAVAAALAKDHIDMLTANLEDLGDLAGCERAEKLLDGLFEQRLYPESRATMWRRKSEPETIIKERSSLRLAAAVGLLRLGRAKPIRRLEGVLKGLDESISLDDRVWLAKRILRVEHPVSGPLVITIAKLQNAAFEEQRSKAVQLAGERRIAGAKEALGEIYWDKSSWGHLKFHAGVSLLELGAKKALKNLLWYLPKYEDDKTKKDRWKFVMGKLSWELVRWDGSGYIDALDKFERRPDPRVLPLILELLKPVPGGARPAPAKRARAKPERRGPAKPRSGTRERDAAPLDDGQPDGPEPIYTARNQFVRARAVDIAALVGGAEAGPVVAKAVDDYRSVVRGAALRAIGKLSGRYTLPFGASAIEEAKVRPVALAWLASEGLRKSGD